MTLLEFGVLLLIAGICGSLGQSIAGYSRGGCLVAIALGFIGALVGRWLAGALRLPEILSVQVDSASFPIVWSIIGAALFVALVGVFTRGGASPRNR